MALLFASCAGETTQQAEAINIDLEKELAAIEELRANFSLAVKEGRYQDIAQYCTKDVETIRAGGDGWNEMFALGEARGRFPYDSIEMRPVETVLVSDSVAYDWGSSFVYYTNSEGEQVVLRDKFLVILKKQDGEWKLHREVASSYVE